MNQVSNSFNFSQAEVIIIATNLASSITRDQSEFTLRGVTALMVTAMIAQKNVCDELETDEEMLSLVSIKVDAKNTLRETIMMEIQNISGFFEQQWGLNSSEYRGLGLTNVTIKSDYEFLHVSKRVRRLANANILILTPIGLTAGAVTQLNTNNNALEVAIDAVHDAQVNRSLKTEERNNEYNTLFELIVKYCHVGKLIWENVDPVKYSDYELYGGQGGGTVPGKIMHFTFIQDDSKFTWDAQINILNYEIESSTNQTVWTNVYIGTENHFDYAAQEGNLFFRCRAVNETGAGGWSDTYNMSTFVATPHIYSVQYQSDIHKLTLLWQIITSHTIIYEVWQSKVPLGIPAGGFTNIGNTPNLGYFIDNPEVNFTYYYYVVATTTGGRSGKSNVGSVEVPA